jgi:hypothetical protein
MKNDRTRIHEGRTAEDVGRGIHSCRAVRTGRDRPGALSERRATSDWRDWSASVAIALSRRAVAGLSKDEEPEASRNEPGRGIQLVMSPGATIPHQGYLLSKRNLEQCAALFVKKEEALPRFYINFRTAGQIVLDDVGQDLPGLEEAKATAIASAREILANNIRAHDDAVLDSVIIANERGEELATIAAQDVLPHGMKT